MVPFGATADLGRNLVVGKTGDPDQDQRLALLVRQHRQGPAHLVQLQRRHRIGDGGQGGTSAVSGSSGI